MRNIITTSILLVLSYTITLGQDVQEIKVNKKNEFRSGLMFGAGVVDFLKADEEKDLSISLPYQNSGLLALSFHYDFNLTDNIALSPRIDVQGSFKRLVETFEHPKGREELIAESRIISAQANIFPVQVKFGLRRVKLYASYGWFFGKIYDYSFLISDTAKENTLDPFHNESDKGNSIIAGMELGKFILEGYVDYSSTEIIEGYKQKFIGARVIMTIQ